MPLQPSLVAREPLAMSLLKSLDVLHGSSAAKDAMKTSPKEAVVIKLSQWYQQFIKLSRYLGFFSLGDKTLFHSSSTV